MEKIKESKKEMILVIGDWSLVIRQWMVCLLMLGFISSCSVSKQISKQANDIILNDTAIRTGHIGISIYEPATDKYWYNYNATKYFIPASNTKLFTLYAGMKYLGDSLVGLRYQTNTSYNDTWVTFEVTGDPTFLHPDFKNQPVYNFFKKNSTQLSIVRDFNFKSQALGKGWAWDDYNEDYMVERSGFPINGNLVTFTIQSDTIHAFPELFSLKEYSSVRGWNLYQDTLKEQFRIWRNRDQNFFNVFYSPNSTRPKESKIPFKTADNNLTFRILENILGSEIGRARNTGQYYRFQNIIHSQPSDSLFKPMMHRSDNFFAEQTLLMASNEHLGYMSDEKIIDTLLKTDLKDVPQKPKWVDGSGLSRYNLFTPQSFVYILHKTKNEFGWERIKNILPTGGKGTLSAYYKKDSGFIYAKTGTLSNNCALSGYLITKKGKLLIFSVLANNYITGATPVRRAVEKFLLAIRENY
jgi:D-alanyl-D-alanine carboxypeptidase/D-alanyl-D-alanine-endopeptidase (penicillin-binding protein 4)